MTTIPNQADVQIKLQQLQLRSRSLAAELRSMAVAVPSEPQLTGSENLIDDTAAFESHVANLEALKGAAVNKPAQRATAGTAQPAGKLTLDDRCRQATAERRAKEQEFRSYCATLMPKKEESAFTKRLNLALEKKRELGLL
jgi:hypothetical protein